METNELKWLELTPDNSDFYGMNGDFVRMPLDIAKSVSSGVAGLSRHPAGGRIRFSTNSRNFAIRAEVEECRIVGFDMYRLCEDGEIFCAGFRSPEFISLGTYESNISLAGNGENCTYTLNFPYNARITKFELGIDPDASFGKGARYRNEKPVVFYGSSITTGAWAHRPGLTYEALLSQRFNMNYLDFGFSGNCKGEPQMADYLKSLDMGMFVFDYDHNAPTPEYLEATHLPFYKMIREKHPDIPVLILTRPDYVHHVADSERRESIIRKTYEYALSQGHNTRLIPGKLFFAGEYAHNCTVDGCHPNDIGFFRMASVIAPVLAEMMGFDCKPYDVFEA